MWCIHQSIAANDYITFHENSLLWNILRVSSGQHLCIYINIARISLQETPRCYQKQEVRNVPIILYKAWVSYYITTLTTYTPSMSISPRTFQTSRQWKASRLSGGDQVQFHNPSVVYAQEHHHGFAQIQESRPLPSLHLPKGTAGGWHTWFSSISCTEKATHLDHDTDLLTQ